MLINFKTDFNKWCYNFYAFIWMPNGDIAYCFMCIVILNIILSNVFFFDKLDTFHAMNQSIKF